MELSHRTIIILGGYWILLLGSVTGFLNLSFAWMNVSKSLKTGAILCAFLTWTISVVYGLALVIGGTGLNKQALKLAMRIGQIASITSLGIAVYYAITLMIGVGFPVANSVRKEVTRFTAFVLVLHGISLFTISLPLGATRIMYIVLTQSPDATLIERIKLTPSDILPGLDFS